MSKISKKKSQETTVSTALKTVSKKNKTPRFDFLSAIGNFDIISCITFCLDAESTYYFLFCCKTLFDFLPQHPYFKRLYGEIVDKNMKIVPERILTLKLWEIRASQEIYNFRRCWKRQNCNMYIQNNDSYSRCGSLLHTTRRLFPVAEAIKRIITEFPREKIVIISDDPVIWLQCLTDYGVQSKLVQETVREKKYPSMSMELSSEESASEEKPKKIKKGNYKEVEISSDRVRSSTAETSSTSGGTVCQNVSIYFVGSRPKSVGGFNFLITDCEVKGVSFMGQKNLFLLKTRYGCDFNYFKWNTETKYSEEYIVPEKNIFQYVLDLSKEKSILIGADYLYTTYLPKYLKRPKTHPNRKNSYDCKQSTNIGHFFDPFGTKQKSEMAEKFKTLKFAEKKFFERKCKTIVILCDYNDGDKRWLRSSKYQYNDPEVLKFSTNKKIQYIYLYIDQKSLDRRLTRVLNSYSIKIIDLFMNIPFEKITFFDSWVLSDLVKVKKWGNHPSCFTKKQQDKLINYNGKYSLPEDEDSSGEEDERNNKRIRYPMTKIGFIILPEWYTKIQKTSKKHNSDDESLISDYSSNEDVLEDESTASESDKLAIEEFVAEEEYIVEKSNSSQDKRKYGKQPKNPDF
jgi:hypothetical protein